jgi:hypothetical protein
MNSEWITKVSMTPFHNKRGDLYGKITGIIGYEPKQKIGDKVLIFTKEEIEENDRQFEIAFKHAKQMIEDHKKEQELKQKKLIKKEQSDHLRKILLDEDYQNEILNIAVENKWVELVPVENDLFSPEELEEFTE